MQFRSALLAIALTACSTTTTPLAPCKRGTFGIEPGEITHAIRASQKLPREFTGAVVDEVEASVPLQKDDIITGVGSHAITNACELIDEAFDRNDCNAVKVTVLRKGLKKTMTITPVDQTTFYKAACAAGSTTGCFRLGWLTWSGDGVEQDEKRALEIYADACKRGSAEACSYRGLHLSEVDTLARACDLGSGAGCAHLGMMYATGKGVARDDVRATPLYVRACDLGDARGCYNVGLMYAVGRGVETDLARAIAAYEEGCRSGSSTACTNLGFQYENGEGVPHDAARAAELYRQGCDGTSCQPKNLLGCVNLGRAYRDGIGVEKDAARAAQLFDHACHDPIDDDDVDPAPNQSRACALLGSLYLIGSGVDKDLARGRELSEEACEKSDAFGCFNAATIQAAGLGVDADIWKAAHFYEAACDLDDGESCYELSLIVKSEKLRQKACKLGFEKACS